MKHQKVAVLFVFLVLIVMTGCAPKESWVEVGRMSVPHVAAMVAFFDESHGFTVGGSRTKMFFTRLMAAVRGQNPTRRPVISRGWTSWVKITPES